MMRATTSLCSGPTSRLRSSPSTSLHSCSGGPGSACAGRGRGEGRGRGQGGGWRGGRAERRPLSWGVRRWMGRYIYIHVHVYMFLMKHEKEGRKEASKVKQTTRQTNTAHPRQSLYVL